MSSWKARLLMLLTTMAMVLAVSMPTVAQAQTDDNCIGVSNGVADSDDECIGVFLGDDDNGDCDFSDLDLNGIDDDDFDVDGIDDDCDFEDDFSADFDDCDTVSTDLVGDEIVVRQVCTIDLDFD